MIQQTFDNSIEIQVHVSVFRIGSTKPNLIVEDIGSVSYQTDMILGSTINRDKLDKLSDDNKDQLVAAFQAANERVKQLTRRFETASSNIGNNVDQIGNVHVRLTNIAMFSAVVKAWSHAEGLSTQINESDATSVVKQWINDQG